MVRKSFAFLFVGVLAVLVIALPVMLVGAQQTAPTSAGTIEFVGFVEAIDATTITVNGQVINVSTAELNTGLSIGSPVKVEGIVDANGAIFAVEVNAADDDFAPGTVELQGVISSFDGTTLLLSSSLALDATGAEINVDTAVGTQVEVEVLLSDTGVWVVQEINAPDDDDDDDDLDDGNDDIDDDGNDDDDNDDTSGLGNDNEDAGNDSNDDNSSGLGNDNSSGIGNDNEDDGNDDNDDSSGLGNDNADTGNDGNDDNDDDDGEDIHLTGTLDAVQDGFIVVGGQTINIGTANVEANLVVGSLIEVEMFAFNGQWVATEVKNADLDDDNSGPGGGDDNVINCAGVPGGWTTYVIQSGDSLSGIASRSGTNAESLAAANCISLNTIIHPGDVIAVPRTPDPRPVNLGGNNDDNDDSSGRGNDDDGNDDGNDDDSSGSNSGPGGGNDDGNDDDSGRGNDDDGNDDNSSGGNDDDGNDDDGNDDSSGGNDDDGNDDDSSGGNSGPGGGDDDDD